MTINKLQGQNLNYVRLFLLEEVFSHGQLCDGQLCVVFFIIKTKEGFKVLIYEKKKQSLRSLFKKVFHKI